jgi:hypothetical protein
MGLFDGTTDPNGGLMGMFANPQTAGLLGMAQGLLQASGPSRIPVSMGQALGNGLGQMQQGVGNAFQTQQQLLRMRAMQGLMGGAQPQQSAQADPTLAQGSPVYGTANIAPMSGLSAGLGGAAPQMQAPQASPASSGASIYGRSPQDLFQQGMLMNMAGIQGGGDMMRIAVEKDPALAMQMPTDIQRNAAAAYGQGTPEYMTALRGAVDKEGVVPLRPGAGYFRNGQLQSTPGPAPAGFMNVPDQNSPTGWSVAALPGGGAAVKQSAAAASIGKAYGNTTTGFDAEGNPTFINAGALADQTANGGGLFGGSNGRFPGSQAGGQSGGVRPSLGPAEASAQATMGQKSATQYAAEQQAAGGFGTRMFNLNKALTGLQNADTGPGSDTVNTAKSFLLAHGPGFLQSVGVVDPNKIQSYDEANKYLIQYAMNQAGALGEGTDSKLATTLSGNANTHISNLAAQDVVRANMALERMNQAAVNAFSQTGLSPDKFSTWKSQFASRINPSVFAWDTMDTSKKQAAYKSMNDAQRQQFTTQYNWALQNGFIGQ